MPTRAVVAVDEPVGPAPAGLIRSARRLRLRKYRTAESRLIAEGPQAVREALTAGLVDSLLATRAAAQRHADLVTAPWYEIDERQAAELGDTVHPSGLLALCRWAPERDLGALEYLRPGEIAAVSGGRPRPEVVVVCAQIRDPGNLGTVIRCADAFGAGAVILSGEAVDPANAKTVRASAGSLFHLPILAGQELAPLISQLKTWGYTVLATDAAGPADLASLGQSGYLNRPIAWIMGNEAWGLPAAALGLADRLVRIPMWGSAESLNLATAAAVCLYATSSAQTRDP